MRALLVVNPRATTTTARSRDVLLGALAADLKVEVALTEHRGHAVELAREARWDGMDAVVALGGDGTVNEVVNGLLAAGVPGAPALGVVPGGSTNVFARAVGLPGDPMAAAGQILDALRAGRRRRIGLGRADERWFTFCAGLGLDAEVVHEVERAREAGRVATPALYLACAVRHFFLHAERRRPGLVLEEPTRPPQPGLHLALVGNVAPWTYLGSRRVDPWPQASFDTGLDLFALRRLGTLTTLRHVRQLLAGRGRVPRGRHVLSRHDVDRFTVRSSRPVTLQVDGDVVGQRSSVDFTAVPHALDVLV